MRTHIKAFTYKEKIPDVRRGICCQTIRPLGKIPVEPWDKILFHGWEGVPYRSKWSWRLLVIVNDVHSTMLFQDGLAMDNKFFPWYQLDNLARQDGIKPMDDMSEGESMGWLFNVFYPDLPAHWEAVGQKFQIIRWDPKTIAGDRID